MVKGDLEARMSKQDLFETLTPEQRQSVDYLLDEAFANGYSEGYIDGQISKEYDLKYFSE